MKPRLAAPDRVHLISHANPAGKDIVRLGFKNARAYFDFIRNHLPAPLRLTASEALFEAQEDQQHGGRRDDAARVRDLQHALDDPRTRAIVAANGGAYFSRLLPDLDFTSLNRRCTPLWTLGFSEMTTLVNLVASYRAGRGLYWLCPNYLAWKIRPRAAARSAFGGFWRALPQLIQSRITIAPDKQVNKPGETVDWSALQSAVIRGHLVAGSLRTGPVRVIGGCLSVLSAALPGLLAKRLRSDGRWLALEDVNEEPYRIDRYLATLKLAGWFERLAGVLLGDFHTREHPDQRAAVLELLRFHLPAARRVPVVITRDFGHVWPMAPLPINAKLFLTEKRRRVEIARY